MTSLFTPLHLGGLSLKNRAVRSATQDDLGTAQGQMTRQELALYTLLARQNVGLIFSAHCYVSPEGKASPLQNSLDSEKNLPMLQKIAQSVHAEGSCMAMQISHAGAKAPGGKAPSDFSAQELENLKQAFVRSALISKEAGMDGVQLHLAHGYLLSQFLSPLMNSRKDEYGSSNENRIRFPLEVLRALREACGNDFPLFIKVNCNLPQPELEKEYEQELLLLLEECKKLGVAAAEISGCNFRAFPPSAEPYYLKQARSLQKAGLPLILVGGIRSGNDAQACLDAGFPLVSFCRPFVCEPEFLQNVQHSPSHRSPCIGCGQCFRQLSTHGRLCPLREEGADRALLAL